VNDFELSNQTTSLEHHARSSVDRQQSMQQCLTSRFTQKLQIMSDCIFIVKIMQFNPVKSVWIYFMMIKNKPISLLIFTQTQTNRE